METETEKIGVKLVVCFDDKSKTKSPVTLENPDTEYLKDLNEKGHGIFQTANSFFATAKDLVRTGFKTKRHKEFLSKLNEVFGDLDICKDGDGLPEEEREKRKRELIDAINEHCPASVYVITKNGLQPRWQIDEKDIGEATQQKYVNVTNGIIEWSKQHGAKGDPVKDVTRVLRKPGYYHHKSDPYLVTEEKGSEKIYTLDELQKFFPYEPATAKTQEQTEEKNNFSSNQIDSIDIRIVVSDVWKEKGYDAVFDKDDHLVVDNVMTATFVGRKLPGNYIATTSSDYPAKGNAVTYVAETLGITTKEAFKWLSEKYKLSPSASIDAPNKSLESVTAEELCTQEFPPTEWMIHRIIPENQITVVSGPPGVFKTMSETEWAIAITSNAKAYGHFDTMQCPVLIVNEDGDHKRIIKKRILFLTETPSNNFHLLIGTGFKVEEKEIKKLLVIIKTHNIKFVIFDSFRAVMPSDKKESDAGDVREVINRLRPLTVAGVTILIIHHDRKKPVNLRGYTSTDPNDLGEMMSGSVDIRGAVDCHLAMGAGRDKKDGQFYIIITQTKCREDELLPAFKVTVNTEKDAEGRTTKMQLLYAGEYKKDNEEETISKAKDAIMEFMEKSDEKYIWRQTITDNKPGGFASRTLEKALKVMEETDRSVGSVTGKDLGKAGAESKRKYYFIGESTDFDMDKDADNLFKKI